MNYSFNVLRPRSLFQVKHYYFKGSLNFTPAVFSVVTSFVLLQVFALTCLYLVKTYGLMLNFVIGTEADPVDADDGNQIYGPHYIVYS